MLSKVTYTGAEGTGYGEETDYHRGEWSNWMQSGEMSKMWRNT